MSQENVELIRGLYDSFSRGDVPAVLSQMDEQIEWREADNFIYADRSPYIGPQAILEGVYMRLGTEWDSFAATPAEFFDAGNHVVVLGAYTGKHKQTQKQVQAQFAHVWGVKEGSVVRFQQYTDTKQFADAIAA
ncbi:MAG: nuclear transport factor 2 family protein [Mojavia pulchra JT2-VF2]|jgi:ketosteroid isomerase-like protein|uniref:Nuclear transport factor 2 family protein n=1 Tax=Mojavia pulchra JT2-VF2 TaxID=287848 RepID=A0A951PZY9_9NOST|nr:nuclear transport factor 2 family protein [Mojavia pulchra JT2-VF2]